MGHRDCGRQPGRGPGLKRLFAAVACACLTGPVSHANPMLSVVDDTGNRVQLERPAQRIVTLSPHATELVVAAGAAPALVAVASGLEPGPELAHLPRIGGPGGIDRERLLALRPDLVIAWQSGNRASDLDWMARTGIAVFRSEPRTLADFVTALRSIGRLAGTSETAAAAASGFAAAVDTPCTHLPPLRAYVAVWERPSLSLGGRHWLNDVLRHAGFRNALAEQDRGVMQVAPETVLALSSLPRVSLIRRFDGSPQDRLADLLSRPGPRLAEAVQAMCAQRMGNAVQGPR